LTLFSTPSVVKAQYIASSNVGYDVCALDAVFQHAIDQAVSDGKRYFDFGTSNRNEGKHLSASLYQFKHEFGGGGVAYEFYDVSLGT
jgi:lipid II:glycine glycyltransferase (peptidoglycan interpeptide bridge formation enzyme)